MKFRHEIELMRYTSSVLDEMKQALVGDPAPIPQFEDESVHRACQEVRALVNVPRRQQRLSKRRGSWHQICTSMDVIEDCELAIAEFESEPRESLGGRYLSLYGLLQAMYVQQTAVFHLAEALRLKVQPIPQSVLETIRDVRNDGVGHPTKSKRGSQTSYHYVSRPFLGTQSFEILSFFGTREEARHIPLLSLISEQRREIAYYLREMKVRLEAEDERHRAKYNSERLVDFLSETLPYFVSKLSEGIHRTDYQPMSRIAVDMINGDLARLREALIRRDEWNAADWLQITYAHLAWSLRQLAELYEVEHSLTADEAGLAEVCIYAVDGRLKELRPLVAEYDNSYSQPLDT